MRDETVKKLDSNQWEPTRREVLGAAAAATLGLLSRTATGSGQTTQPAASRPAAERLSQKLWWMRAEKTRARVVDIRSSSVLHASVVDPVTLGEMLDQGIQNLTGITKTGGAWRSVLRDVKRIVLKFNSVGARNINTSEAMARVLVGRLAAAGYDPEKIVLVEAPEFLTGQLGTGQVVRGWGSAIEVGGTPEPLAQYLYNAEAIINVPFLKTHQIAGMSCCLKNLSHALIRHPARYHANGCSPYVGQVIATQEVSSKLKLNVVNAVRVVVNHGPDACEDDLVGYGGLLLGFDPLAVDSVGLSILSMERRRLGLAAGIEVPYMMSAAEMGLGRWRPADIDRIALETDS